MNHTFSLLASVIFHMLVIFVERTTPTPRPDRWTKRRWRNF